MSISEKMNRNPLLVYGITAITVGAFIELIGFLSETLFPLLDKIVSLGEHGLTQSDPGHMLFLIVGLSIIAAGLLMCFASRSATFEWKSGAALMIISIAATFGISQVTATPIAEHNHSHIEAGTNGEITHTHGDEIKVSLSKLQEINNMLGEVKAATAKYSDVNLAMADGYLQEGPSRPKEGAHFINRKILDKGVFDLTHPTFLLYEHKLDWSFELVGVGWLLPKTLGDETPPPYFSPIAAWHFHEYAPPGICIWNNGTTNIYDEAFCKSAGGTFWQESPWMLHAWVFRESPEGVFSLLNSSVGGIQFEDFSAH